MKFSKFLTTLGITTTLVTAQMFGLPNQKQKMAQAHCNFSTTASHCASHLDPTPVIPGSKQVAEEAWGEAGRGLYSAAAEFMSRDNVNIPYGLLDSRQKELLRPEFGSLVDRVKVKYGADMMDRWGSGNFQISQGSAGQTFCNTIYIQDSYRENDNSQLILLAHELQHSRQCENLGGMSDFGYRYFKEFKKAGQSYENNALEIEARDVADRVDQYVASQTHASNNLYKIKNKNWGKCLNLQSDGNYNGGKPNVWDCVSHPDQEWHLEDIGGGYYKLRNKNWGKCLNLQSDSNYNGGKPNVWDCVSHPDQEWSLQKL